MEGYPVVALVAVVLGLVVVYGWTRGDRFCRMVVFIGLGSVLALLLGPDFLVPTGPTAAGWFGAAFGVGVAWVVAGIPTYTRRLTAKDSNFAEGVAFPYPEQSDAALIDLKRVR
jgi:hypothetical protein